MPLLGSMVDVRTDVLGLFERGLREYGDTVRFRFGPFDFVVIHRPEDIRTVLLERQTGEHGDDLLSMLMDASDESGEVRMTDAELRDEVATLVLAGHGNALGSTSRSTRPSSCSRLCCNAIRFRWCRAKISRPTPR